MENKKGGQGTRQQAVFLEGGAWDEDRDKYVMIDNLLTQSDNPRIINYKLFSFPVEDPVEMSVICERSGKVLNLKSYRYPAYYDQQHRKSVKYLR